MEILELIKENYLIVIAVLYVLGMAFKYTALVRDKYIPLILICIGVVFCILLALNSGDTALNGALNGILCAGVAVLSNQMIKQLKE